MSGAYLGRGNGPQVNTLTDLKLDAAVIAGINLHHATSVGFTQEQLYSTRSYSERNLQSVNLSQNDLTGWDFHGQDLSNARLDAIIAHADLRGANVKNAYVVPQDSLQFAQFDSTTVYNQWTVFPDDFDPASAGLTLVRSPVGDLNADGLLNGADIDAIGFRIRNGARLPLWMVPWESEFDVNGNLVAWWTPDTAFDFDNDTRISTEDLRYWVERIRQTWFGDANLDGEFNTADFVQVLELGRYEQGWIDGVRGLFNAQPGRIHNGAGWSEGDWNGDGLFDTADLVTALIDGGYEQGPRIGTARVPEPSGWLLWAMGLPVWLVRQRARRAMR